MKSLHMMNNLTLVTEQAEVLGNYCRKWKSFTGLLFNV